MNTILLSKFQETKRARDLAIWTRYNDLMSLPGTMRLKAYEILMEEFNIASPTTIWSIRKQFEIKLNKTI